MNYSEVAFDSRQRLVYFDFIYFSISVKLKKNTSELHLNKMEEYINETKILVCLDPISVKGNIPGILTKCHWLSKVYLAVCIA